VVDSFVDRDAGTDREDEDGNHETPEVNFLPVSKGIVFIGRFLGPFHTEQQKNLVAGINQRMNAFREHCRTSGAEGRNEFDYGDQRIPGERSKDYFSGGTRHGLLPR